MIRKAKLSDLEDIMDIINETIKEMKLYGNDQWDDNYPNKETFINDYGFDPIRIIDLKALMGDASDNIPGVKGVGEKTAINLIQEYDTIENLYDHIDDIKGNLQEKLILDKDSAFFSKKLATILLDVPIEDDFDNMLYTGENIEELTSIFEELEFYSFMKKFTKKKVSVSSEYKVLTDVSEINKNNIISYYIESDNLNYHYGNILGMGLFDGDNLYFINKDKVNEVIDYINDSIKYTFDLKKNNCLIGRVINNTIYDHLVCAELLEYNFKDDISILMKNDGIDIEEYNSFIKNKENIENVITSKAKYIYDIRDEFIKKLKLEDMYTFFVYVEMPLVNVLSKLEMEGIKVDKRVLDELGIVFNEKIEDLRKKICELAGEEFNVSSPKQLGIILFEKLGL